MLDISKTNRILIIRLSSLGDVLLASPVIRALKQKKSGLKIDFLVRRNYEQAVKHNPYLNEVISFNDDSGIDDLCRSLNQKGYDLIADLQNNFRSRKILRGVNAPVIKFVKPSAKKFLLVHFKINFLKDAKPIPVRYAEVFNDIELDNLGPEFHYPNDVYSPLNMNDINIGLCPGSRHYTKMWPKEYFIEFGRKLSQQGFKPVIIGGRADKTICDEITNGIPGSVNLVNEDDLFLTADNMKKCKIVVTNDSGLMHLASAVGTPLIAVFGSTVREFGFYPYRAKNLILENNSLSCRPCSHIGRRDCPKKHFKCMRGLNPQLLFTDFLKFYDSL